MATSDQATSPGPTRPPANEPGPRQTGSDRSPRRGSASPFVADPGPTFDARQADELAAELPPAPALFDSGPAVVEEDTVRGALVAKGELLHLLAGAGHPDAWRYTEADLKAIAPPVTRILNRYPAAAEVAATLGDPAAAGVGFFNYGLRSLQQRQAAVRARQAEPDQPVSGVAAPAGTGPTPPPATGPTGEVAGGGPHPTEEVQWNT